MNDFNTGILDCLNNIKGSGFFVSSSTATFIFPGLEVDRVGELSYPINELQAKALISQAHKAPFGKGSQTILDDKVRSAWEIDASRLKFKGNQWPTFLDRILKAIKPDLGIEGDKIGANLYKMLIYEKGDFFLPHKDSEKEKGMFGTLVIGLPSRHSGGELVIRFDGKEKIISFDSSSDSYEIPYAAFYADCDHEIRPLTDGYRACLVYNLIQLKPGNKLQLEPLEKYVANLSGILKEDENNNRLTPTVILLQHQYTPENFSKESLKLNDRTRTEVILRAAAQAGYYAKMCLVTSYLAGAPAVSGYNMYEAANDDAEMEEVYDESLYIEHWLNEGVPPLRNIQFEENDLLATFRLNDGEPIVKESTGYMGNYGPDLMHWYHYGAVVLWSKKMHERLVLEQDASNQLEWLAYYNKQWDTLEKEDIEITKRVVESGLSIINNNSKVDFTPLAVWLINLNDEKYLSNKGSILLTNHFAFISVDCWVKLFEKFRCNYFESIFTSVATKGEPVITKHLLNILNQLYIYSSDSYKTFVVKQFEQLPAYLNTLKLSSLNEHVNARDIFSAVLEIDNRLAIGNAAWNKNTSVAFTETLSREYVNDVLMVVILKFGKKSELAQQVMAICKIDLMRRVNDKPTPPPNWSRPVPQSSGGRIKAWSILSDFLKSPDQNLFDYKSNEADRTEMAHNIRNEKMDIKMETIKRGSPYTLRLTKTQDTYLRELAKWNEDVKWLKKAQDWM
jgi:hypothetical protein